jgi:hypothetical protein
MKRLFAVAACALGLSACSSMPSWMQFDHAKPAPAATTMQFESEPAGAEARTSTGQTCRTPCSVTVTASEFTVSFGMPGFQPQTVPVRLVASAEDPSAADGQGARLVPNPVFVDLHPVAPAVAHKPPPVRKKPKPAPHAAPTAMAPTEAPAPAPASPWPPPSR